MGSNTRAARRRQAREDSKRYEAKPQNLPAAPILPIGYEFVTRHEAGRAWVECIHQAPNFQTRFMISVDDIPKYVADLEEARVQALGRHIDTPSEDEKLPSGLVIPSADISSKYG